MARRHDIVLLIVGLWLLGCVGIVSAEILIEGKPLPEAPPVQLLCLRDTNGQVTGTTSATVVPGSACTIPANALLAGRALRITGFFLNPAQGSTPTTSLAVRLGGTAIATRSGMNSAAPFQFRGMVWAISDTTQMGHVAFETSMGAGSSGTNSGFNTSLAIDMTQAQTLDIQITPGATTDDYVLRGYIVELLQP